MASSRLGFRGVEDLGGGLKAGFWLEGALGPDTGTGDVSFGNGTARALRASSVVRPSACKTSGANCASAVTTRPTFWNWTVFDPFGTNGVGSALNLAFGYEHDRRFRRRLRHAGSRQQHGRATSCRTAPSARACTVRSRSLLAKMRRATSTGVAASATPPARSTSLPPTARPTSRTNGVVDARPSWNVGWFVEHRLREAVGLLRSTWKSKGVVGSSADQDNWYVGISAPLGQANLKATYGQVKRRRRRRRWPEGQPVGHRCRLQPVEAHRDVRDLLVDRQHRHGRFRGAAATSALTRGNDSTG